MRRIERKLIESGIDMTGIEVVAADEVEIAIRDAQGNVDSELSRTMMHRVAEIVGFRGGYSCGHGGWVLRKGYEDKGDYNDRASAWHY